MFPFSIQTLPKLKHPSEHKSLHILKVQEIVRRAHVLMFSKRTSWLKSEYRTDSNDDNLVGDIFRGGAG